MGAPSRHIVCPACATLNRVPRDTARLRVRGAAMFTVAAVHRLARLPASTVRLNASHCDGYHNPAAALNLVPCGHDQKNNGGCKKR